MHGLIQDYCLACVMKESGSEVVLTRNCWTHTNNGALTAGRPGRKQRYFFRQLCHHLIAAGRDDEALALLVDFDWLQAKTRAGSITDLCRELFEAGQSTDLRSSDGLGPWYYFLRSNPQFLQQYPNCFFQQAFNEPIDSPVSQAAQQAWEAASPSGIQMQQIPDAFLEWTNRHRHWVPPACLMTLTGHESHINGVACSADGRTIISGSADMTVKVWDVKTGACLLTCTGHKGWVRSVACSADGTTVVSGAEDEAVKVWDACTGMCRLTLTGHLGYVLSVVCSPDADNFVGV